MMNVSVIPSWTDDYENQMAFFQEQVTNNLTGNNLSSKDIFYFTEQEPRRFD